MCFPQPAGSLALLTAIKELMMALQGTETRVPLDLNIRNRMQMELQRIVRFVFPEQNTEVSVDSVCVRLYLHGPSSQVPGWRIETLC